VEFGALGEKKKAAVPGTAAFEVLLRSQSGFGAWCDELWYGSERD
jgi:hypothetical protein